MTATSARRLAALLTVWLVLIGGNYALYIAVLPIRIAHHVVITGVLVWWLWRRGLPYHDLVYPVLGMVLVVFASAANANMRMGWENAWFWFGHGLLLLLLIDLVRMGAGDTLLLTHLFIGLWIAGVGVLQMIAGVDRPASLLLITNLAGAYCAPLVLVALAYRRNVVAAALFGLVLINESRAGLMAVVIGVIVLALLIFKPSRKWLVVMLPVAALGAALFAAQITSSYHRLDMWRTAGIMIASHPLTGVGPGLYGINHRSLMIMPGDYVAGAHNWLINTAAELGALGLFVAFTGFVLTAATINRERTMAQNGALAALAAVVAYGVMDHQVATAYAALVAVLVAVLVADTYLVSLSSEMASVDRVLRPVVRIGAVAALVVYALWFVRLDTAQVFYERSLTTGSLEDAQRAYDLDSLLLYQFQADRLRLADVGYPPGIEHMDQYAAANFARWWR